MTTSAQSAGSSTRTLRRGAHDFDVDSHPAAKRRTTTAPNPVLVPGTHSVLGENLLLCHDRDSGLSAAIAVDDTTLGPGLGGVRWMAYPSFDVATEEACRLSRVMTLKNALAEIPFGGAKSVIMRQEADDAVRAIRRNAPRSCWLLPVSSTA